MSSNNNFNKSAGSGSGGGNSPRKGNGVTQSHAAQKGGGFDTNISFRPTRPGGEQLHQRRPPSPAKGAGSSGSNSSSGDSPTSRSNTPGISVYNRFAALDDHNSGGQQQQQQLKQTNGGGGSRSPPKQSLPPPPSTTITSTSPSSSYHGYNINDRALWNIVADKKTNAYNFRDDDAEVAKIINSPPSSSSSPSKGGSSPIKEAKNNSNSYNNNNNTSKNQKISTSSVVQDLRVVPPPSLQTNNTSYSSAAGHNIERQNIGQQFFTPYHTGGGGGGGGNGLNTSAANSAVSSAAPSAKSSPLPSRRGTEKHSVALTRAGHLVVEIPAPQRYLDKCAETRGREFTHIRYTAVTTNADEFAKSDSGFDLRPALLSRPTELFIVMTMYNEDETLFGKSMASVMRNIAYICSSSCPRTWGPNGWTNVVVCIVADGRSKIQRRVLDVLGLMGVYQDGIVKLAVGDKPVQAHLFEFTTQLCVDENLNVLGPQDGIVPVQILFCLKEKNHKKINSHRWFFNAFGPILDPNVCVLLDVGTKPTDQSIYHLWRAFDRTPDVGGACGEICAELGTGWSNLMNPLVAAQNFEYKMSNILDKPLESMFGFIAVLPGAFSAYRYRALYDRSLTTGPLVSYFKGETLHAGSADLFSANMYLAEDRILCFELYTKRKESWILKYVKNARAETDVPSTLPELVSQRKRWLNGSFFAAVHAITHYPLVYRSSHPFYRKVLFTLQTLYNIINLLFSWFSIGNFYLTFYILFNFGTQNAAIDPFNGAGVYVFLVLNQLYVWALVVQFVTSFGNRPQGTKWLYHAIVVLFAFIMVFLMYVSIRSVASTLLDVPNFIDNIGIYIIASPLLRNIVIALLGTYGMYMFASVLHLDPWHMFTSLFQYMLLLPTYVNVFMIYAFCNLHDLSWGTKGDNLNNGQQVLVLDPAQMAKQQQSSSKNGLGDGPSVVEMEMPTQDSADSNRAYEDMMNSLKREEKKEKQKRDAKTKTDDYFRLYRTRIVLFWLFCNLVIVFVFTNPIVSKLIVSSDQSGANHPYLTFIFWSVTALAAVRLVGCIFFLMEWVLDFVSDVWSKGKVFDPSARHRHHQQQQQPQQQPGRAIGGQHYRR